MDNPIICIAQFTAKNGKALELQNSLSVLVEPTRKEAGCISYTLHQDKANDHKFVIIEHFKDQAALNFHSSTPYITKLKNEVGDLVEINGVSVTVCKPLNI